MTAQTAYRFLKSSIDNLSQFEKEKLCRLILDRPEKKKRSNKIMSKTEMKKRLLNTHFKS